VFENRDTIRFQIQEMARVERLYSDEQIETELRIYKPLVPSRATSPPRCSSSSRAKSCCVSGA
jgi:hypothetical protein